MRRVAVLLVVVLLVASACSPAAAPRGDAKRSRDRQADAGAKPKGRGTGKRHEGRAPRPRPSPSVEAKAPGVRPWWKLHVDKLLKRQPMSIQVRHDGDIIYARRPHNDRVPASVQKLALSMALFEELGVGSTFPTRLAARRIKKTVITGDLWVIGSGDPTLAGNPHILSSFPAGATDVQQLVRALRDAGIKEIQGNVMGATGPFARDWYAPGWKPFFPVSEVGLPSALTFNGNVYKQRYTKHPERVLAESLRRRLRRDDVTVVGEAGAAPAPKRLRTVTRITSPPLEVITGFMNRQSSNFFAEVLGKRLGAERFGRPGTIAKGARAVTAYARERGVEIKSFDSSGLSYENLMSASDLAYLIETAEREPWVDALRRGLPGGGQGTLQERLHDVRLRAKTGTLDDISSLAGWVWLRRAREWGQFAIISRGIDKSLAMQIEDNIVRTLHRYAR